MVNILTVPSFAFILENNVFFVLENIPTPKRRDINYNKHTK